MANVRVCSLTLVLTLLCSGCSTTQVNTRSMAGINTGAAVGNMLGSAVGGLIGDNNGGWHGAYRGSSIGSILGTVAGVSVGYAITSAKHKKRYAEKEDMTYENTPQPKTTEDTTPYSPLDNLRIENVHFISDDQQQLIRPEEVYKIAFEVINKGTECATTVIPKVEETSGKKRLYISPSLVIDQIAPYSGIRYTATVRTGEKIKTGEAIFRISIGDAENREYDWLEFTIPTER